MKDIDKFVTQIVSFVSFNRVGLYECYIDEGFSVSSSNHSHRINTFRKAKSHLTKGLVTMRLS